MIMAPYPISRGSRLERTDLKIGFIPLTDCAPLVAAKEWGFFSDEGLEVELTREASWAAIRDKVAFGLLDGAHMLSGIPIAATAGIAGPHHPMVTGLSLSLNGNAITVSNELHERILEFNPQALESRPVSASVLMPMIQENRRNNYKPLTFATVFPVSSHHYELRYWLSAAGIDPDRDLRLVVVPPHEMVGYLRAGYIDGYCVGEPWNEQAVLEGVGQVLITSHEIWNNKPEKVLGVTRDWAEAHPHTHLALIRALLRAAREIDGPDRRMEVARLIAQRHYVDAPFDAIAMSMAGRFHYSLDEERLMPDFNVFHRYAANFPWRSHAMWTLTQMGAMGAVGSPVAFEGCGRGNLPPRTLSGGSSITRNRNTSGGLENRRRASVRLDHGGCHRTDSHGSGFIRGRYGLRPGTASGLFESF